MQQLDCDFFVFSGHKIFAPTGIGVVYAKKELLDIMPPWQGGGNMIRNVTFEETTYTEPPAKFEAGTPSIADAVGLGAALDYVNRLGLANIGKYEHELLQYGTEKLSQINGLRLIGTAREKVGVLSFVLPERRTEDVGRLLDLEGIAVRAGHHCVATLAAPLRPGIDRPPVAGALQHQGRRRPSGRRDQAYFAHVGSRLCLAGSLAHGLPQDVPQSWFHGMRANSMPMPQVSVMPAKTSPAPTNPAKPKNQGLTVRPSITPVSTSDPAAIRTCRSSDMVCLPRTTGKPCSAQALVPPSTLTTSWKPARINFSQAFLARVPPWQIR